MKYEIIHPKPNHSIDQYGFELAFQAEYLAETKFSGGGGHVTAHFNHIDENYWDVPTINISFDDGSEDYSGLMLCMIELCRWFKENSETIASHKASWLAK